MNKAWVRALYGLNPKGVILGVGGIVQLQAKGTMIIIGSGKMGDRGFRKEVNPSLIG